MKKLLLLVITSMMFGCTSTGSVITGKTRSPITAEEVKLYLRPPLNFESVALINATVRSSPFREKNREEAVEELKKLAASMGANGVLLNPNEIPQSAAVGTYVPGYRGSPGFFTTGATAIVEMQGEAIHVMDH